MICYLRWRWDKARGLRGAPPMYGCCACRRPFRHLYLEDGEAVCDDHLIVEDTGERVEFLVPFEPMTERRFFLLLDAAEEGWYPPGAVFHENAHVPCPECNW